MIRFKPVFTAITVSLLLGGLGTAVPSFAQATAETARSAAATTAPTTPAAAVTAFIDAWNAHDGHALGRVFTVDGDFVGIAGRLWHSPEEIARVHAEQFAGRYDTSRFTVDGSPSVALIRSDVALVHWRWTISGVREANGATMAPYSGIFTWVVVNQGGGWRVRAAQNNVIK